MTPHLPIYMDYGATTPVDPGNDEGPFWAVARGMDVERVRRARDRRQPWAPEPSWRVTRVVGVHDTGDIERRVIVGFREVDLVRVVEGPRVTRKW